MTNKHNLTANYYFKQDPEQDKHICEVFSSQFMRFIAEKIGENPEIIADVSYIKSADQNSFFKEELSISSKLFTDYHDLFLDAYLAYQLPAYQPLRTTTHNRWTKLPKKRPSYFEQDPCIDNMIEAGRYKEIIIGLALRTIVDDPDTHFKNIGAIPIVKSEPHDLIPLYEQGYYSGYCAKKLAPEDVHPDELQELNIAGRLYYKFKVAREPDSDEFKEAFIKYNNNYYLIPNIGNTQAVQVDFGGSLGDFRLFSQRKLDGKIHIRNFFNLFRYHPSYSGPPAYQDQISDALTTKATYFYETLVRYSMIDKNEIEEFIEEQINNTIELYKDKLDVLISFAKRIGLNTSKLDPLTLERLGENIKYVLLSNFVNRQKHAKLMFLEYFFSLNYTAQLNLVNAYNSPKDLIDYQLKESLMMEFFQNLKEENQQFFTTLKGIKELNWHLEYYHDLNNNLWNLKNQLHQRLSQAYLTNQLEKEALAAETKEIIKQTQYLLNDFIKTKRQLARLSFSDIKEAQELTQKFINTATQYEQTCTKASTSQDMTITACTFAGALIGTMAGAAIGLIIGGIILGPITIPAWAAVGASLGIMVSTTLITLLCGAYTANKLARYHLFSPVDNAIKKLSHSLSSAIYQEPEEPQPACLNPDISPKDYCEGLTY